MHNFDKHASNKNLLGNKKHWRSDVRRDALLYVMLIPGLIYVLMFKYAPMYGVSIAFRDYSIFRGFANAPFVGFENFVKLFNRSAFLRAFRDILIKKYCEVPSQALSIVAPQHLNLGMRYNRLSKKELIGNESFSVSSFNCYRQSPTQMLDMLLGKLNMPALIGEWHIAAQTERNFASGLVSTPNQQERAKAWLYYTHQAVSHPMCVGLHYFEYNDQPLLGRFDGECMQHGLISVCNVPYPELSEAMHEFSQQMYELANQKIQPTTVKGEIHGYHA